MDSDDEFFTECPLCMESIDIVDSNFKPCICSYQICTFCYDLLVTKKEPCPACRREYKKEYITNDPVPPDRIARYEAKKRLNEGFMDDGDTKDKKFLKNARITQYNLVYVLGIPNKLASPELLMKKEYFGQYGKISKLVCSFKKPIVQDTCAVYVTYSSKAEAERAIDAINGIEIEGKKALRASFGTTKYCKHYLKNSPCPNEKCLYLHEKQFPDDIDPNGAKSKSVPAKAAFGKTKANEPANAHVTQAPPKHAAGSILPKTAGWAKGPTFKTTDGENKASLPQNNEFPDLRAALDIKPKPPVMNKKPKKTENKPINIKNVPNRGALDEELGESGSGSEMQEDHKISSNQVEEAQLEASEEVNEQSQDLTSNDDNSDSSSMYKNEVDASIPSASSSKGEDEISSHESYNQDKTSSRDDLTINQPSPPTSYGMPEGPLPIHYDPEETMATLKAISPEMLQKLLENTQDKQQPIEPQLSLSEALLMPDRSISPRTSFCSLPDQEVNKLNFPRRSTIPYFKLQEETLMVNSSLESEMQHPNQGSINDEIDKMGLLNTLNAHTPSQGELKDEMRDQAQFTRNFEPINVASKVVNVPDTTKTPEPILNVRPNLQFGLNTGREEIPLDELFQTDTSIAEPKEQEQFSFNNQIQDEENNLNKINNHLDLGKSSKMDSDQLMQGEENINNIKVSNEKLNSIENNTKHIQGINNEQSNNNMVNALNNRYEFNPNQGAIEPTNMNTNIPGIIRPPNYMVHPYYPMIPPNRPLPQNFIHQPNFHPPMHFLPPRPSPLPPYLPHLQSQMNDSHFNHHPRPLYTESNLNNNISNINQGNNLNNDLAVDKENKNKVIGTEIKKGKKSLALKGDKDNLLLSELNDIKHNDSNNSTKSNIKTRGIKVVDSLNNIKPNKQQVDPNDNTKPLLDDKANIINNIKNEFEELPNITINNLEKDMGVVNENNKGLTNNNVPEKSTELKEFKEKLTFLNDLIDKARSPGSKKINKDSLKSNQVEDIINAFKAKYPGYIKDTEPAEYLNKFFEMMQKNPKNPDAGAIILKNIKLTNGNWYVKFIIDNQHNNYKLDQSLLDKQMANKNEFVPLDDITKKGLPPVFMNDSMVEEAYNSIIKYKAEEIIRERLVSANIKENKAKQSQSIQLLDKGLLDFNYIKVSKELDKPLTTEQREQIYNALGSTYDFLNTTINTTFNDNIIKQLSNPNNDINHKKITNNLNNINLINSLLKLDNDDTPLPIQYQKDLKNDKLYIDNQAVLNHANNLKMALEHFSKPTENLYNELKVYLV